MCSVKYKVAENGNTQVKYQYLLISLKFSTLVNVLSFVGGMEPYFLFDQGLHCWLKEPCLNAIIFGSFRLYYYVHRLNVML